MSYKPQTNSFLERLATAGMFTTYMLLALCNSSFVPSVSTFSNRSVIDFDLTERRGRVHFLRGIQDDKPRLESTGFQASVVRGVHQLLLIP